MGMTTTTIHDLSGELQTAVPRGDDATVELTLGAVRDLLGRLERLERLEQLEKQAGCDACQGQIDALAARVAEHDNVLDAGTVSDLQHLLTTLQASGVTRYQRGDVVIELRPAVAVDAPGMSQWLPDAEPDKDLTDDDTPEQPLTASGVVLPSLDELRQESDARRRQQEEDRSGVAVEVQEP